MASILIKNACIVNENKVFESDVLVKGQRIEKIDRDISEDADMVIDASNKYLIPGMIDDQVHFREPGFTHKGHIESESKAAIAGGVTSFMEMPNTVPQTLTNEALEAKHLLGAEKSFANYSFYFGASNDNLEDIKKINPQSTGGLKVFMGASTGNMLVDDPIVLEEIFKESPVPLITHCEDTPTIKKIEDEYRLKYGEDVPFKYHPDIRSADACYKSSSMAIDLAKKHGTELHVLHLSTEKEMDLFESTAIENKHITAEVCVHHLFFDADDYERLGSQIKCNPAIKYRSDKEALIKAVKENKLDIIGTDHAPHTADEKSRKYFSAPSGIPLVQHALYSLFEFYKDDIFDLEMIVDKTSHAVAKRFKIKDRGFIREGYFADLALIDFDDTFTVKKDNTYYHCGWSPFENYKFRSRVLKTILNGELVYDNGNFNPGKFGMRLEYNR